MVDVKGGSSGDVFIISPVMLVVTAADNRHS